MKVAIKVFSDFLSSMVFNSTSLKVWIACLVVAFAMLLFAFGKHKDRIEDFAVCLITWLTISFKLPSECILYDFSKTKRRGWMLALVSPAAIVTYSAVLYFVTINFPLPFDKLEYTEPDEICSITGIKDFPEYEYVGNVHNGWDGSTIAKFRFVDKQQAERLFKALGDSVKCNVFWTQSDVSNEEGVKIPGGQFEFNRGWAVGYVRSPEGIYAQNGQVSIVVQKEGFTVKADGNWMTPFFAEYSTPKRMKEETGVLLPDFHVLDVRTTDYFNSEYENHIMLMFDKQPDSAFIMSLQDSKEWRESEDGSFVFGKDKDGVKVTINVEPNSRLVRMNIYDYK